MLKRIKKKISSCWLKTILVYTKKSLRNQTKYFPEKDIRSFVVNLAAWVVTLQPNCHQTSVDSVNGIKWTHNINEQKKYLKSMENKIECEKWRISKDFWMNIRYYFWVGISSVSFRIFLYVTANCLYIVNISSYDLKQLINCLIDI